MRAGYATRLMNGSLQDAFAKVRADSRLQFVFPSVTPPPKPPHWLVALSQGLMVVFKLIGSLWPVLKVVIWLVIVTALITGVVYLALFAWRCRRRSSRAPKKTVAMALEAWRPSEGQARALLAEADAMAAAGRFEEAAHLLLLRSVEDIQNRRPAAVRPSLTSRDIANLDALPAAARDAFSTIAAVVEASWFGGQSVDADGFIRCRRVYEAFALPEAWVRA